MINEWEDISKIGVTEYRKIFDIGYALIYKERKMDYTWPEYYTIQLNINDRDYWSQSHTVQQAQNWVFNVVRDLGIK